MCDICRLDNINRYIQVFYRVQSIERGQIFCTVADNNEEKVYNRRKKKQPKNYSSSKAIPLTTRKTKIKLRITVRFIQYFLKDNWFLLPHKRKSFVVFTLSYLFA